MRSDHPGPSTQAPRHTGKWRFHFAEEKKPGLENAGKNGSRRWITPSTRLSAAAPANNTCWSIAVKAIVATAHKLTTLADWASEGHLAGRGVPSQWRRLWSCPTLPAFQAAYGFKPARPTADAGGGDT
jgi:glycine betaine/choline ABC-type transport system substrate-binding protein